MYVKVHLQVIVLPIYINTYVYGSYNLIAPFQVIIAYSITNLQGFNNLMLLFQVIIAYSITNLQGFYNLIAPFQVIIAYSITNLLGLYNSMLLLQQVVSITNLQQVVTYYCSSHIMTCSVIIKMSYSPCNYKVFTEFNM